MTHDWCLQDAMKMQKLLNQKLVDNSVDEESDDDDASVTSGSRKKKKMIVTTPMPVIVATTSVSPGAASNISPKAKIPQNPLLKKKLLNLQRFLAEYTVCRWTLSTYAHAMTKHVCDFPF